MAVANRLSFLRKCCRLLTWFTAELYRCIAHIQNVYNIFELCRLEIEGTLKKRMHLNEYTQCFSPMSIFCLNVISHSVRKINLFLDV